MTPKPDGTAPLRRAGSASGWKGNGTTSLRGSDFRVQPEQHPGWIRGSARTLRVGETVHCAAGEGVVLSLLGKTGDGSRLLQIQLRGATTPPYFAAASNVLVGPV